MNLRQTLSTIATAAALLTACGKVSPPEPYGALPSPQ